MTLREMARDFLVRAGQPVTGSVLELVGRALTSSDFPYVLANVAHNALHEGYDTADETWRPWCGIGNVSDFKTNYRSRASEFSDLDEILEGGEYTHGSRTETRESFTLSTFGKKFMITRQAIVNDELGALTDTPFVMGEAAARKVGDAPYAVLTANSALNDGVALFHAASHGNLSSSNAAVSIASLAAGILAMKSQKDLAGLRRLNIRPQFFIAPLALEGSTLQFFGTNQIGGVANQPNLVNPYADPYFTKVYDGRLDDNSTTAWFLAGPKSKSVEVVFLNGQETPLVESKPGWDMDGQEFKVRIDVVAYARDYRTLYQNAGA